MDGHCLCGAVTVRANKLSDQISACHCDMCRRWSGSIQMGIEAQAEQVALTGPVKRHQSSPIAERAWCETFGSALWFRYTSGPEAGYFELAPGLFDNAADATLTREVYSDRCPGGYALSGDHERVSKADYETNHAFVKEGD